MATVDVILVVGKEKISVRLSKTDSQLDDDQLTVNHLAYAVHKHAGIQPESQKLIYRGRTLFKTFDPEDDSLKRSLASLGIKNGDRIMVFGKPGMSMEDTAKSNELMKVLDQHQARIDEICVLCSEMVKKIGKDLGSLDDLKRHQKFFIGQSEYSMQELTRLDATPGDVSQCPVYKARRKALVNKLLENVALCDNQVSLLKISIEKCQKSGGRNS